MHCVGFPIRKSNLFVTFERQKSFFNFCLFQRNIQSNRIGSKHEQRTQNENLKKKSCCSRGLYSVKFSIFAEIEVRNRWYELLKRFSILDNVASMIFCHHFSIPFHFLFLHWKSNRLKYFWNRQTTDYIPMKKEKTTIIFLLLLFHHRIHIILVERGECMTGACRMLIQCSRLVNCTQWFFFVYVQIFESIRLIL